MFKRNILATGCIASFLILGTACAATDNTRSTGQAVDDSALTSKIKAALIDDKETKARQINVEVYQGQVQLVGFVDSPEQKAAAGRVAAGVAGVRSVKNNLEVQPRDRSAGQAIDDGVITAKVKAALIGDSRTKAHQIEVNTMEGIVQLGGFVDSAAAKAAAGEVAQSISGVKTVHNRLEVK